MQHNKSFTSHSNLVAIGFVMLLLCTASCSQTTVKHDVKQSVESMSETNLFSQSFSGTDSEKIYARYIQHLNECSIQKFECIVECEIHIMLSQSEEQQQAASSLANILVHLLSSLTPLKEGFTTALENSSGQTLSKIAILLNKLSSHAQTLQSDSLKKFKSLTHDYIISTVAFNEALSSAVERAPIDVVNTVLSSICQIYQSDPSQIRQIICMPLKSGNYSLLYKALLRSRSDSIAMILCLVRHLVDIEPWLNDDTSLLSHIKLLPLDIKSCFLDQQVEYAPGKYHTALHFAIENANSQQVQCLLELGADPNIKDSSGKTALHLAFGRNEPVIVGYLLKYGASLCLKNSQGVTIFSMDQMFNKVLNLCERLCRSRRLASKRQKRAITDLRDMLLGFKTLWKSGVFRNQYNLLRAQYRNLVLGAYKSFHQNFPYGQGSEHYYTCQKITNWLILCNNILGLDSQLMFDDVSMSPSPKSDDSYDSQLTCDSAVTHASSGIGHPLYCKPLSGTPNNYKEQCAKPVCFSISSF
ncbi:MULTISPECIES: ankyrin repeat domain-containing protein [Candidatus Cardinium]|uniref:ankyrin repeat domain-containing protein n=1 Tax=Candidatus Cardinium TaxID=273135 RepID=UPI001FA9F882|nr:MULTISPECIES: ankyrin repeat domain-containing protein [Cardinium]